MVPDPKQEWWSPTLLENDKVIEHSTDLSTLTRRYTEHAVHFISVMKQNEEKPFFLYFAHTYPHVPLFASKDFRKKSARGLYGDVVEELDWSVGQVLAELRKDGLAKNTLVFFTSDNGPWLVKGVNGGSAGPLRGGKGSTWEGGMREPGIAWWPGKIAPGIVTHDLASSMDLFNTCLNLAGAPLPTDRVLDGVDLRSVLFGVGGSLRNTMYYYQGNELYALRLGRYKAHFKTFPGYSKDAPQPQQTPLLFDLGTDPGESYNVAAEHPEVLAEIQKELERHQANLVPGRPQY